MEEEQQKFTLSFIKNGNLVDVHREIVGFSKMEVIGMLESLKHEILNEKPKNND